MPFLYKASISFLRVVFLLRGYAYITEKYLLIKHERTKTFELRLCTNESNENWASFYLYVIWCQNMVDLP